MEGQGKRLLLAVALALGVMLVWNMVFPSKEEPKPTTPAGALGSAGSGSALTPVAPRTDVVVVPPSAEHPAPSSDIPPTCGAQQLIELKFPEQFTAKFCSYGGTLSSWKLADERFKRDEP